MTIAAAAPGNEEVWVRLKKKKKKQQQLL